MLLMQKSPSDPPATVHGLMLHASLLASSNTHILTHPQQSDMADEQCTTEQQTQHAAEASSLLTLPLSMEGCITGAIALEGMRTCAHFHRQQQPMQYS